ncbi:hypothetical protein TNCV_3172101 [Trichonephila clavipes]|nr:hypothetical protein TNCV_3172101 [Trichonephila clavipes]
MQKCQTDLKNSLEKKTDNVKEKINSAEDRTAGKMEEKSGLCVLKRKRRKKLKGLESKLMKELKLLGILVLYHSDSKVEECEFLWKNESKFVHVPVSSLPDYLGRTKTK